MSYPRFRRSRAHKFIRKTSGNTALAGATGWTVVDAALDLTIEAQVGDTLKYELSTSTSTGNDTFLEAFTLVGTTLTNGFGGAVAPATGSGVAGWIMRSAYESISGPAFYEVQAGDLVNGLVTVRLCYRQAAAGARTLISSAADGGLFVALTNLGPSDDD